MSIKRGGMTFTSKGLILRQEPEPMFLDESGKCTNKVLKVLAKRAVIFRNKATYFRFSSPTVKTGKTWLQKCMAKLSPDRRKEVKAKSKEIIQTNHINRGVLQFSGWFVVFGTHKQFFWTRTSARGCAQNLKIINVPNPDFHVSVIKVLITQVPHK